MLNVVPILPRFGAEISGINIAAPLSDQDRQDILKAMNTWGIGVFRNTGLTDKSHIEFSRYFGHLELAPRRPGMRTRLAFPELFDAGNLDLDGNINRDPAADTYAKGNRLWHTDGSYMQRRNAYSLLLAHRCPSQGGETWFADTRSAYEDLPNSMKKRIENLQAENSLWWSRKVGGADISDEKINAGLKAVHPIVHVHKGSGRKALFVAAHTKDIIGLPQEEGRALIRELIEFATQPQYIFNIKYQPGDLVIWDNLCSMHKGGEFDTANEARDMRRTTVRESLPGDNDDDDPYAQLWKEMPDSLKPQSSRQKSN